MPDHSYLVEFGGCCLYGGTLIGFCGLAAGSVEFGVAGFGFALLGAVVLTACV